MPKTDIFFAISYKYRRERIIHDSKNWKKNKTFVVSFDNVETKNLNSE